MEYLTKHHNCVDCGKKLIYDEDYKIFYCYKCKEFEIVNEDIKNTVTLEQIKIINNDLIIGNI